MALNRDRNGRPTDCVITDAGMKHGCKTCQHKRAEGPVMVCPSKGQLPECNTRGRDIPRFL